eukprot:Opistho-2@42176
MAFFQLTYMGPQDPIRARLAVHDEDALVEPHIAQAHSAQPPSHFESSAEGQDDARKRVRFPPINDKGSSPKLVSASLDESQLVVTSAGATRAPVKTASHKEYEVNLRKHRRPNHAPRDVYKAPVTSSQNYGWAVQDYATESWMKTPRHGHRNSEMTK